MTTDFPEGSLPHGYHVLAGYPVENDTEDGLEATIVYVGPAEDRWLFLEEVFGRWEASEYLSGADAGYESLGDNRILCATLVKPPRCYQLRSGRTMDFGNGEIELLYDHLWPDTFTIRPVGDPSPEIDDELNPDIPFGDPQLLEQPIGYGCVSEITVNYRSKYHARWPVWVRPEYNTIGPKLESSSPSLKLPDLADGTFVQVSKSDKIEFQTIPGRNLKYWTSAKEPGWDGSTGSMGKQLPQDINYPVMIGSTDLEVEWSNVPVLPSTAISLCEGKINVEPFLGYPVGSVLFLGADVKSKQPFYHRALLEEGEIGEDGLRASMPVEIYRITYRFAVQTVLGIHDMRPNNNDPLTSFGRMGYFNRRWSKWPIPGYSASADYDTWTTKSYKAGTFVKYDAGNGLEAYMCVIDTDGSSTPGASIHWTKVQSYYRTIVDATTGETPYSYADFNELFKFPTCPT